MSNVVHSTQFEGGFSLEQLENDRGHIYYRACTGSICRYAEDEYIARMYLEGMGWDPTQPPLDLSTPQSQPPALIRKIFLIVTTLLIIRLTYDTFLRS